MRKKKNAKKISKSHHLKMVQKLRDTFCLQNIYNSMSTSNFFPSSTIHILFSSNLFRTFSYKYGDLLFFLFSADKSDFAKMFFFKCVSRRKF